MIQSPHYFHFSTNFLQILFVKVCLFDYLDSHTCLGQPVDTQSNHGKVTFSQVACGEVVKPDPDQTSCFGGRRHDFASTKAEGQGSTRGTCSSDHLGEGFWSAEGTKTDFLAAVLLRSAVARWQQQYEQQCRGRHGLANHLQLNDKGLRSLIG